MLARTPATAVPRGGAVRSRKVCASAVHPPAAAPSSPQQPPAAASSSSKGSLDGWIELSTKKSLASGNGVPKPSNVCRPEDLVLPPGELSAVDRTGKGLPSDVFRCFGCKEVACQGPTGCAKNQWRFDSDGYLRAVLTARVYDVAIQTPLEVAKKMSGASGNTIMLKREDLQPVFSFKLRGAYNKMASLPKSDLERGVITASAGNHAQGVALAAGRLGCKAIICMPVSTPDIKVANVRRLGGIVELVGESYQETQAYAAARSESDGLPFIAPYDDPYTIAGQGTIGDEILRQIGGNVDALDAVFVPIGGGGLIAGIAAYLKALKPSIKVIGVEPTGANAMAQSLMRGERVMLSRVDAFADGVAVKQVGFETFRLCQQLVDGVVLVDNGAISSAIKDVFNETRSILEPAGAVGVAGALAWLKHNGYEGKTVVAVTSGANMNFDRLRLVADLANVGATTEATLATCIPEEPESFRRFINTVVAAVQVEERGVGINITEFKYRFNAGESAQVLWGAGIQDSAQLASLIKELNSANMPTVDVSKMEAAQLHLRHLVGGRARCAVAGTLLGEHIFQVIFPENPGALNEFVTALCPWNVTLFHYRTTGNRESSVLLGIQIPDGQEALFAEQVTKLSNFTFKDLAADEQAIFARFLQ